MRNPFRSELEAFHFLLLTVAAFAAIAVAGIWGGLWAGVPVFAVVTIAAVLLTLGRRRTERLIRTAPPHVGGEDELRVLVVANEALVDGALLEQLGRAPAGGRLEVLVVCPALVSQVRQWTSDVDGARALAEQRLGRTLAALRAIGIEARGTVGDEDPLRAIEDALRSFPADEIVVSSPVGERPGALGRGLVAAARERFALPIRHLAVDDGEAEASA